MKPRNEVLQLARFIYTHNPFYLISTALVLYGLQLSFDSAGQQPQTAWALAAALAAYTTLLGFTGFLVVRLGKVWEDARSILLVVVLMFLAISVNFDQICNSRPGTATNVLTLGCLFSLALSEVLIRALRLKLPWSYRGPFYFILALFFVFPLWVSPVVNELSEAAVRWRIMAFPLACSLGVVSLIPAAHRGASLVAKNGTPWDWPWYPWPLFVFVAFCVCFRSYILTLSFQSDIGLESSFSAFYLVPFLFAILILLLEIAIVQRAKRFQAGVLLSVPLLLVLAIPWSVGASRVAVTAMVVESIGSPLWLTLLATCAFYLFAWCRQIRTAEVGLVFALMAATVIGPRSVDLSSLAQPNAWPVAVLAAWQLVTAVRKRSRLHGVGTGLLCAIGFLIGTRGIVPDDARFVVGAHIVLFTLLLTGSLTADRLGRLLQQIAAVGMAAAAIGTVAFGIWSEETIVLRIIYIGCLTGIAAGYWFVWRTPWWLESLAVNLAAASAIWCVWAHASLRAVVGPRAIVPLTWGFVFFVMAAIISCIKGGAFQIVRKRLNTVVESWRW